MNYRHAFHAGNFADVLKHATLALVVEHLKRKPAPFRVVDTHAGAGSYDLSGPEARRTGEWRLGIARLVGPDAAPIPANVAGLLAPYLDCVRGLNPAAQIVAYPGSPSLVVSLLRPDDRLIASELHPEDGAHLVQAMGRDARVKVLSIDGWQALRANLPPKERRGVVLIDPPFEEPGELERLAQGLAQGVRRFATGTYILWFPIKDEASHARFRATLGEAGYDKLLLVELAVRSPDTTGRLTATGLAILNPPFQLDAQLRVLLPFLEKRLAQGPGSRHGFSAIGRTASS